MMLPPLPPRPSGRIVRRPHLRPSAVPRMFTSSMVRMSFGSTSVIRLVISTPALLTRMSSPPKSEAAAVVAFSQLASSVTSRCTKPCPSPLSESATFSPASSCRSAMTTRAPLAARAWAMPSPSPWAPPVTRAVRPVRSRSVMGELLCSASGGGHNVPLALDSCQDFAGHSSRKVRSTVKMSRIRDPLSTKVCRMPSTTHRHQDASEGRCQGAAASAGRQVRRAPQPARRVGAADARRARLRPLQPARDREQLGVQPRGRALLLPGQARADHLLRAATTRSSA